MAAYWLEQETLMRRRDAVGPAAAFFRELIRQPGMLERLHRLLDDAEGRADTDMARTRVGFARLTWTYVDLLRNAMQAGAGTTLDALPPSPKGNGHLGPLEAGRPIQLRFPVPRAGHLALRLGNVVAMTGAGRSYQLVVRKGSAEGPIIHTGKRFEGTDEEAERHLPARAWNSNNRAPVDVTEALTDRDRESGTLDVWVTALVTGDHWTMYRDDDGKAGHDLAAAAVPQGADQERKQAWETLEAFVEKNADSGILNAAPGFVLRRCRDLVRRHSYSAPR
jgi:hypothetical protein